LQLDVLDIEAAAAFLLRRTEGYRRARADDRAKAREIAAELGGVALALEQAGACIAARGATFAQYQEHWRDSQQSLLADGESTLSGPDLALAVTWHATLPQLTSPGRRLLARLAWLAEAPFPDFLLDVASPGTESENLHEACENLVAYGLVTRDAAGRLFTVHPVIQEMTRRSLVDDPRRFSLLEALHWMDCALAAEFDAVGARERTVSLARHALAVTNHAEAVEFPQLSSNVVHRLGRLFCAHALYAEAEQLFRRALAVDEKTLGPDHAAIGVDLNDLAQLLCDTNRYAEAEPLMRRGLALGERHEGPRHPNIATRLSGLAKLFYFTGRLAEAEPLMRRALSIDEKNVGPNHPKVAHRLNDLAQLLQDTGRHAEAESLMRRALALGETNFGPDHIKVASYLNNLAQLLTITKRFAEAEPLLGRALAIAETHTGAQPDALVTSLTNLAALLLDTGRLDEAEPLYRRALAIQEGVLEPDHPDIGLALHNLGRFLEEARRRPEAEPMMRRAVGILAKFERSAGHKHRQFATVLGCYVDLLHRMGKSDAETNEALRTILPAAVNPGSAARH
jgi:tetratricopeptide (TPR) repeat protein